jgi:hypothetical protein
MSRLVNRQAGHQSEQAGGQADDGCTKQPHLLSAITRRPMPSAGTEAGRRCRRPPLLPANWKGVWPAPPRAALPWSRWHSTDTKCMNLGLNALSATCTRGAQLRFRGEWGLRRACVPPLHSGAAHHAGTGWREEAGGAATRGAPPRECRNISSTPYRCS